jgi:FkbM family methyltransferase
MLPRVLEVYSFEPDPRVLPLLENNVRGKRNVEVVAAAVGAAPGRARFTLELHSEVSHLSEMGEEAVNQIVVDVVTIDAFVAARSLRVEGIKIDVEGHDLEVIEGALNVLREQQPLVLTEAHPDAALFALARRAGCRVFAFVRHTRTRRKHFAELEPGIPVPGETKMLFLVPPRLSERFLRLVAAGHEGKSS